MNKKLICLTLSILMLLSCLLTGCAGGNDDDEIADTDKQEDNSARTITMWLIGQDVPTVDELPEKVRDSITPEGDESYEEAAARVCRAELKKAQDAVQAKFAAMTKAKFNTNVILKFCTEDEYYDKLEEAIAANQKEIEDEETCRKLLKKYITDNKSSGKDKATLTTEFYDSHPQYEKFRPSENATDDEEVVESDVYIENDDGVKEIKYPDEKENQVDIFYMGDTTNSSGGTITGYSKYMEYYESEWLASLSEELSTSSKKLKSYISTSLLNGVQIEGGVYAIPNNVPIGEYTYMFIDKELFDGYYQKIDNVRNVTDLGTFLDLFANHENEGKDPTDPDYIVPIASSFEECIKMLAWYWDIDYTDRSVYETYYDEETGRTYVLQTKYTIKAGEEADSISKDVYANVAVKDQIYKTNDEGEYVDADGNVLGYTYAIDNDRIFVKDPNSGRVSSADVADGRALYLVDENGEPVTAENDKRVILTEGIETKSDEYGNVNPTYQFFINDDADFSILGTAIADPSLRNRGSINLAFNALFANDAYNDLYATLKSYEYNGYYGTPAEGQRAAVSFVKGDARILQDYNQAMEDLKNGVTDAVGYEYNGRTYYVVVAEYPTASHTELYGNMYAVYANSAYLSRAMKVITYLNTNSEMRDLLQYGVEDVHYERNEDGTVSLLSNDPEGGTYRMKMERTGNCFIATPEASQGANAWDYAKIQNNAALVDPLLGFDFNSALAESDYSLDVRLIDYIKQCNAEAQALIRDCDNEEALITLLSDADNGFKSVYSSTGASNKEKMEKALNRNYDPSSPTDDPEATGVLPDPDGASPYTVYYKWLTDYKYLPTTVSAN